MIISMNVSHFVNICQVLTILHQLICRVSLILGHGVVLWQVKWFTGVLNYLWFELGLC